MRVPFLVLTGHLPALLLLTPALLMAGEAANPVPPPKRATPVTSLLPPGSILSGVLLPRYDINRRLVGALKAKTMTLVSAELLDAETVAIELFNPDRSPRARLDLTKGRLNQTTGTLHATNTVTLHFDNINAIGNGLVYELDLAQGFLMGPATTRIQAPAKTAMNPSESPRRAASILGASLIALPVTTTRAQDAAAIRDATSSAPLVAEANAQARSDLRATLDAAADATRAATAFLEKEDLLAKTPPTPAPIVTQARPLEITPSPDDTVINCDGGVYFDSNEGLLVYLKNVTVADPRFTLDGANELKVFFEKKPESPKAEPKPGDKPVPGGLDVNLGDVERVVATGAVHVLQKPDPSHVTSETANPSQKPTTKNEVIEAAGAIFTYNVKTGEIVLSGGKPWVKKGGMINRAKQSDQTLRVIDGKFTFSEGGTETILPLDQVKPPKTEDKKTQDKKTQDTRQEHRGH